MVLGAMVALGISLPQSASAQDIAAARTTVITACGKLFSIDSNAAGLTPEQRATIVQKNLDNALIASKHRTPDAVRVSMMNRNPIVTLDGFYIVTADLNSAERNHMSQMQLAQKWADSIRFCMADAEAMRNYIAMLTGRYPNRNLAAAAAASTDVAVLPWGTTLPVRLTAPLVTDAMRLGDAVTAELTTDIPLAPKFAEYLPAGTIALGEVADAAPFNCNNFAGKRAITVSFYALQTPDGNQIPINGHIMGGANTFRYVTVQPIKANCCAETNKSISSSTLSFGSDNMIETTNSMMVNRPLAQRGTIVGAWRANPIDWQTQENFHRLLLSRDTGMVIPAGVPLTLQLNSSSSISVSSAAPAIGTQVSAVGVGSL